ncbi:unnamed protein product [Microthlaspi erraticum]|uniref:TF-B3 domain-containing protein n=1 Tax=Microthlaspi erraticum TaxID=1685480 RepID=A0A6D2IDZ1_9BRAS|nr:unnamed protein product [Microthlaspi erraticum]
MRRNMHPLEIELLKEATVIKTFKQLEEEERMKKQEERMKRIFDLVPRRRRTLGRRRPRAKPQSRNFPKDPRKRSPVHKHITKPKWLLRVLQDMKVDTDPMMIIQKPLDLNDVDPSLNRLSIPFHTINCNNFMNSDETKILGDDDLNNEGQMGVAAFLVDQRTEQWPVVLKKGLFRTVSGRKFMGFLLGGEWSQVVKANGLLDKDNITLWSFRRNGILFFALDSAGDSIDFKE